MAHKPTDTTIIDGSKNPVDGNAVYDYVGAGGPFLPLAGGTLTGALTVPSVIINGTSTNLAYGKNALISNTTGTFNLAVGTDSLYTNADGYYNVAIGSSSLFSNTTGFYNLAIGAKSLYASTTSNNNVAIGVESLYTNTTGSTNVAVGSGSLLYNTTGSTNVAIGYSSLFNNITGSNCIAIGNESGRYNTASNKLFIDAFDRNNTAGDATGAIITGTMDATPANQTLTLNAATTVSNTLTATQFKLSALNTAPASATATGTLGEIRIASGFIYICVAANTWQRAAIATW